MIILSPWWLLLAALALIPWIGPWRGVSGVQNTLRSLVFIILAVALSRPHLLPDDAPPQRVLIVDQTDSVDPAARQLSLRHATDFARRHGRPNSHLVLLGTLADDDRDAMTGEFGSVTVLSSSGPEGSTPLSAAISHAATLIPRTSRGSLTIASDGLATRGDNARAISALRSRDIAIHVIELPIGPSIAKPVGLTWKDELRMGTSAVLTADVVAHGSGSRERSQSGQISLRTTERTIVSAPYHGESFASIRLEFEPSESGFIDAELVVATDDRARPEQVLPVVLAIRQPHQVLYLGGLQQNGAAQLGRVLGQGFEVVEVNPNDPDSFDVALARCELVVMDDCLADSITNAAEQRLIDAVTSEGLGLVMSGGRASFGSGGWHDRLLESILPVELVQKEEKRDPSTSLVIVIDTSGSMTGVRVQLAKEVARLAMRRLLPHDKVGIVEFYGAKRWAAPIQPASNAIELQRALNRMDAGGGTVILPALEEAFYGLQNVDTRYKHVLVLTDGGVESGDFESLMRRMAGEGINVSTVLAGGGYHSEFLVNLANWGKGRFYDVPNRFNLPEILLKQPSTAKLPAYRPGLHNVRARGGSGWWGDVDTTTIPQLAGYVEAKARPGSEVLLETSSDSHPLLTTWRYGLGRVTTLGTEPLGEGTRPWRDWVDYGKTLARVFERSAADTRDPFRFQCIDDGGEVQVHAIRQRPRTGSAFDAVPLARLLDPHNAGGEATSLEFVAKSPDRYLAKTQAAAIGKTLRIECSASNTPDRWIPLVAASPVVAERGVDPRRGIDLSSLAIAAGGRVIDLEGDWSDTATIAASGKRLIPLSSWLFGGALLLFLVEILWRRRPQVVSRSDITLE